MNATQNDRLAVVDALRGFALLGILMVNIGAFSSTFYGLEIPDPKFVAPFDRAVQFAISALFETKFYLLFSFLFGYSFTLQMSSSERTGRPFAPPDPASPGDPVGHRADPRRPALPWRHPDDLRLARPRPAGGAPH